MRIHELAIELIAFDIRNSLFDIRNWFEVGITRNVGLEDSAHPTKATRP
jgi:hypothetical protein